MSVKKYKLLSQNTISDAGPLEPGTIVYECAYNDYGCASDDTYHTGIAHISVTLSSEGDYPFFTHPLKQLLEIKE